MSNKTSSRFRAKLIQADDEPLIPNPNGKPASSGFSGALVGFLAVLSVGLLAWAIVTTVVMTQREAPRGTRMCGDMLIYNDELCVTDIIVGAGNTGLSVAHRLSRDLSRNVLVLEAGSNHINDQELNEITTGLTWNDFPAIYPYRWYHMNTGKAGLIEVVQRIYTLVMGRLVGGSSFINVGVQSRGDTEYWDRLDTMVNGGGKFAASNIYEKYKSIEFLKTGGVPILDNTRTITENPWKIFSVPNASIPPGDDIETVTNFYSAVYGYPVSNESYNNANANLGVFPYVEMLYDHDFLNRWSSQKAFLNMSVVDQTTLVGPRLRVLPDSTVIYILFHPIQTTKAVGVSFMGSDNVVRRAFATHEVILSANYNDAMILQRSGVGPSTVLANAGITPRVINEQVGQHWKTHNIYSFAWLNFGITGINSFFPQWLSGTCLNFLEDTVLQTAVGQRGIEDVLLTFPHIMATHTWQIQTKSYGNISVYSDDPFQDGLMIPNYFSDPDDLLSMRTYVRDLVSSAAIADPSVIFLSVDNTTLYNDDMLNTWIINNLLDFGTTWHSFGSCRIGADSSSGAIDSNFKVFGATNLRVCDSQSFPIQTSGHPSYAMVALGQVCAETILGIEPVSKKNVPPQKSRTVKKRNTPKQVPKLSKRGTPQEQYDAIVNYFNILNTKFKGQANQIISNIQQTELWKSLEAQFGPYVPSAPAKKQH